jgi:phosphopantetheinyl transferase
VYGAHGKPALAGYQELQFNLSHAGDWAFIVITNGVPAGVDIERIRPQLDIKPLLVRLGESDLPEDQLELFNRWTLREARSKAAGGALFDPPATNIRGVTLEAPEGYAASVALVGCIPAPRYCVGKR